MNNTTFNASVIEENDMLTETVPAFFLWLPIVIIGSLGNSLVIIYFLLVKTKAKIENIKVMSSYHFLIVVLACVDFALCTVSPLMYIYMEEIWPFGVFVCRYIYPLSTHVSTSVSIWLLVLLMYERYRAIVKPFSRKIKKSEMSVIITFLFGIYFGVHQPINDFRIEDSEGEIRCVEGSSIDVLKVSIGLIATQGVFPFLLMILMNVKMHKALSARLIERNENSFKTKRIAFCLLYLCWSFFYRWFR